MAIFTGEYVTISTIIITLLAIAIYLVINKMKKSKNKIDSKQKNGQIQIGLYLAISNMIYFIFVLGCCKILIK
jgi:uncharacterized membrane protein YidH (DUF202 family)